MTEIPNNDSFSLSYQRQTSIVCTGCNHGDGNKTNNTTIPEWYFESVALWHKNRQNGWGSPNGQSTRTALRLVGYQSLLDIIPNILELHSCHQVYITTTYWLQVGFHANIIRSIPLQIKSDGIMGPHSFRFDDRILYILYKAGLRAKGFHMAFYYCTTSSPTPILPPSIYDGIKYIVDIRGLHGILGTTFFLRGLSSHHICHTFYIGKTLESLGYLGIILHGLKQSPCLDLGVRISLGYIICLDLALAFRHFEVFCLD